MADLPRKRRPAARKSKPPPAVPAPACDDAAAAEKAHVESLIASGLAAKPDAQGKLPAGAPHEICETEEGERKVRPPKILGVLTPDKRPPARPACPEGSPKALAHQPEAPARAPLCRRR